MRRRSAAGEVQRRTLHNPDSFNRLSCYGCSRKRPLDSFEHACDVVEHFAVPEANHSVAMLLDQLCSPGILRGAVEVLSAVQLDDQSRLRAGEVRDEVADRELSAETEIGKSSRSKTRPEFLFGIGLVVTQLASAMLG